MGAWGKMIKKTQGKISYETLDPKPMAIIEGVKQPDTLTKAIDRIVMGRYGVDEFERLRGFEFDITNDEEEWVEDADFNESYEDNQGYFIDKKDKTTDTNIETAEKKENLGKEDKTNDN